MEYKRILILGSPGAGKSTFARRISATTGIPVIHLDALFWEPGWIQAEADEFSTRLQSALRQESWIIEGNYLRTLPQRLESCDAVIYLDFPRVRCMWRIIRRVIRYRNRTRPDMTEGCPERIDREFAEYTWNFEKLMGMETKQLITDCGKPILWFRADGQKTKFLKKMRAEQHA